MVKKHKAEAVAKLEDILSRSTIALATDYRGLSAGDMFRLRRRLREAGVEYRVVKNTLARLAADKAGKESLRALLDGPTAIAFGYDDVVAPAKALSEYLRTSQLALRIKGAMLEGRILDAPEVRALASLPPREILLATLLGRLQSPLAALTQVLAAQMRKLLYLLQARMGQLEESPALKDAQAVREDSP